MKYDPTFEYLEVDFRLKKCTDIMSFEKMVVSFSFFTSFFFLNFSNIRPIVTKLLFSGGYILMIVSETMFHHLENQL